MKARFRSDVWMAVKWVSAKNSPRAHACCAGNYHVCHQEETFSGTVPGTYVHAWDKVGRKGLEIGSNGAREIHTMIRERCITPARPHRFLSESATREQGKSWSSVTGGHTKLSVDSPCLIYDT